MYINGLLCYLSATYKYDMKRYFTIAHQHEASGSTWDVDKGGMVTEHDRDLQLDDEDKAYVFTNLSLVQETSASQPANSNIPRREDGSYLDSQVSTVRSEEQKQVASTIATLQSQMDELKKKNAKHQSHIKRLIKAQQPLSKSSSSKDSTLETIGKEEDQDRSLSSGVDSATLSTLETLQNEKSSPKDDASLSTNASGDTTSAGNRK